MHDHETCEQMIAAAMRTDNNGRAEYLSTRCDRVHGDLTTTPAACAALTTDAEDGAM